MTISKGTTISDGSSTFIVRDSRALPLTGGTMSGGIVSSSIVAYQTNNPSHCDYGYNYNDRSGAVIALRSSGYTNNPGGFEVLARNESESIALIGKADGTLVWGINQLFVLLPGLLALLVTANTLTASLSSGVMFKFLLLTK